jgi:hypothetical protein
MLGETRRKLFFLSAMAGLAPSWSNDAGAAHHPASAYVRYAQLRPPNLPTPPPYCGPLVDLPLQNNAEKIESISLPIEPEPAVHFRLVTAGSGIILKLPEIERGQSANILLDVSVKDFGTESFTPVCTNVTLSNLTPDSYFVVKRPAQGEWSIWRLEFKVSPTRAAKAGFFQATLFRDPYDPARAVFTAEPEAWNDAAGYLCENDEQPVDDNRHLRRGFGGKVRLDIDLGPIAPRLSTGSHSELEQLILRAVTLWVQACAECAPPHLAVISLDEKVFVRAGIAKWYEENFSKGVPKSTPAALKRLDSDLVQSLQPIIWLTTIPGTAPRAKAFTQYVQADSTFDHLCSMQMSGNARTTLRSIYQALCTPTRLPSDRKAAVRIRFRDRDTGCGSSPNIIACRADSELTEYNVRDFQFTSDASRGALEPLGTGPVQLDFLYVLLHEMGHWIGLPHIETGDSIMNSSVARSRCIDSKTISALAVLNRQDANLETAAGPQAFTYR